MATYVSLIRFTAQGIKNIRKSPDRAKACRKAVAAAGGRVREIFWTLGEFDGVLVFEMPSDEAAAALMLSIARQGSVQPRTLRAFDEREFQAVLKKAK